MRLREFSVFSFSERLRSEMIRGCKYLHRGKVLQGGEEGIWKTLQDPVALTQDQSYPDFKKL